MSTSWQTTFSPREEEALIQGESGGYTAWNIIHFILLVWYSLMVAIICL